MTQEEKARAYDEALEKARKQRDEYQEELDKTDKDSKLASILRAAISAIELAFPELSESEDERIMKALIEVFKKKLERGFEWVEYGIPNRSVLDWLEKQKENSEYVFRPLAGTDITIAAEQAIRKAKEGDRLVLAFNGFYTPVFKHDSVKRIVDEYDSFIEKPKEQSEEPKIVFGDWGDKEKREAIITCLKYMRFVKKITNQEYDDLIKWLDNNYVKVEQKPVEKHDLLAQLREHLANTPKEQLEAEWKELEKWNNIGPTVKEYFHRIMPAEWSEEDELHRNFIMESLESQIRFQKKDVKGAHYTKQIRTTQNWLKSLSERFNLQPAEWSEKYIADVFEKVGLAKIVREQGNDGLTNALQATMIELSKVRTTEWNEEDKEMLGKVLECIRFAEDHYQLEEEGTNGISVKLWLIDHIIPQPKQEWSEEDKKMCNNILNVLTPYLVYDGTYTRTTFGKKYKYGSEIRWIKSLPERFNLQPKQEWSEEDEKDMAHIIRILDDCYVYGTHDLSKTDRENLVNKLKSLRPSWKPSEEQMKALYDACCIAFEEERDFHPSLSRLYHDLRKL